MNGSADNFYVTTPIYYVNDEPHVGHAYTTILADVMARFHRLAGEPTFFLTGTDEHGLKVLRAAEERGITPKEHCDRTVQRFLALWDKLDITNDDFIRSTEERHQKVVQAILADLHARGEIYLDEYEGWYCVPCERFFTEKDLQEGNCPECGRAVEQIRESNYFFRMGQYQEWLIEYINDHPEFIQPDFRRNETLGFLRQPLGDLCISRPKSRLPWGIELPFDADYVCYVWFDALINYISAIGYGVDSERFDQWWPASYQLVGKDILTTHTVYWPIMLKGIGAPLPRTIFAHGWWLVGRDKMGKSMGNAVDPIAMCDEYGIDAFRYFLMAEMSLGQDSSFTEQLFIERYNNELAGGVGNMLSRVLKMVQRDFGGQLPAPGPLTELDEALRREAVETAPAMVADVHAMKIDRGLERVVNLVKACNRYFEQTTPWKLRGANDRERLGTVLYTAAEALRIVAGLLYPVVPGKMAEMRRSLGVADDQIEPQLADLAEWGKLTPGAALPEAPPLFPRIDVRPEPAAERQAETAPAAESVVDLIDIEQFAQVKLRVAQVLAAEPIEGADKLLKLQIDIGNEKRQIVAGIAQHYAPDELVGKLIVAVANLQPVKIRGIESNGMLLAATKGKKKLVLVTIDGDIPPGAKIV